MCCDLLKATGIAGRPNSFFRPQSIKNFCDWWGVPHTSITTFDQAYIDTVLRCGSDGTGCFGMRMMFSNMDCLQSRLRQLFPEPRSDKARLEAAFGSLRFIHLNRTDKVAQAVSYLQAEQSGLWHKHADGRTREQIDAVGLPGYDFENLSAKYELLCKERDDWSTWFAANKISALSIAYEELSIDPQNTLRKMLSFIGLSQTAADAAKADTTRLANATSQAWADRFRRDAGLPPIAK